MEIHRPRHRSGGHNRHVALAFIQYCHSRTVGCQCISRIPPGLILSMAEAIPFAAGKLLEATLRVSPTAVFRVGVIAAIFEGVFGLSHEMLA